jgi:hypothetical protein
LLHSFYGIDWTLWNGLYVALIAHWNLRGYYANQTWKKAAAWKMCHNFTDGHFLLVASFI